MSSDTSDYYDYDGQSDNISSMIKAFEDETAYLNTLRILYIVGYLIICVLGLPLNFYVIVTSCYSYHKLGKNANSMWVMALAMTHLLCCAFLSLQLLYAWYHFNWHYGTAMCKLSSYVIYTSMFSTAAALTLWSISSVTSSKCCEDLCNRYIISINKFLVLSSWTLGAFLSIPSLLSRELRDTNLGQQCIDDYDMQKEKTTDEGRRWFVVIVVCRFMLGVLVPAFVMIISCCLAWRHHHNVNETFKTFKRIICLIKVIFFVCLTPLLFLGLLQIKMTTPGMFKYSLPVATVLAAAHCCVNPVIYLLVGRSITLRWMLQDSRNTDNAVI